MRTGAGSLMEGKVEDYAAARIVALAQKPRPGPGLIGSIRTSIRLRRIETWNGRFLAAAEAGDRLNTIGLSATNAGFAVTNFNHSPF